MSQLVGGVAVLFCLGLATSLFGNSLRQRVQGPRIGRVALLPLAMGALLLATLITFFSDQLSRVFRSVLDGSLIPFRPSLTPVLVVTVFVLAAILVEMALVVVPERITERSEELQGATRRSRVATVIGTVLVVLMVVGGLIGGSLGGDAGGEGSGVRILADWTLPGPPMDYEALDEDHGYLSVATGEIYLVRLPDSPDDQPQYDEVTSGLEFPRGLAVADEVLFVATLGELACEDPYPTCFGQEPDREEEMIEASSGSLWAFDISPDLNLSNQREVLTDLPIVNTEHGPNDVELGPDGYIYISIGHFDRMWEVPERVESLDHPNSELLGTILRVDPRTAEFAIHASGLRNVYGFDFDSTGRLFAVDNDGPTIFGWRPEMILSIDGGEDFGYPMIPTAGVTRTATPHLAEIRTSGSTAVEWLETGPWELNLLIGGPNVVNTVRLGVRDGFHFAEERAERTILEVVGYVTVIEQRTESQVLIGVTGIYGGSENHMLLIDLR